MIGRENFFLGKALSYKMMTLCNFLNILLYTIVMPHPNCCILKMRNKLQNNITEHKKSLK